MPTTVSLTHSVLNSISNVSCINQTFEDITRIKHIFVKYWKKSCWLEYEFHIKGKICLCESRYGYYFMLGDLDIFSSGHRILLKII